MIAPYKKNHINRIRISGFDDSIFFDGFLVLLEGVRDGVDAKNLFPKDSQ